MKRHKYFGSIKYLYRGLLGYIAYIIVYPLFLSPLIHRLRGVRINSVFRVYIAPNVLLDSIYPEYITIEEDVKLTRGSRIITHFNPTDSQKKMGLDIEKSEVLIKSGAFIGVNSIILPGVTIGMNSVIGAGSVVTKDVPDYKIAAGNPAKVIGDIRDK